MSASVPLALLSGFVSPVVPVLGATTLLPSQSGSLVALQTSAGGVYTVTLPIASPGLQFNFIVQAKANANNVLISVANGAGAGGLYGYLLNATTQVGCANGSIISLEQAAIREGDSVSFIADAAGNWNVKGFAFVVASFIVT